MAGLTQNIEILLDRLYNLKGDDNVLLRELADKIGKTKSEITIAEENRNQNEVNKVNCEGTLELFLTQKQTFEEAFQGLDNDTFSALREIDVNLEIGSLLIAIAERSPEYCEKLTAEIKDYQAEIDAAIKRKEELDVALASLEEERSRVESDREQLVSLLEQSLSPNEIERDSLTAHYVKRIISPFGIFSEDELSKLTKLIMFPDEGLYQYNQTYPERLEKGLVGLTETSSNEYTEEPVEEPIAIITEEQPTEAVMEEHYEEHVIHLDEQPVSEETQEFYAKSTAEDISKTIVIDLSALNSSTTEPAPESQQPEETPEDEPTTEVVEEEQTSEPELQPEEIAEENNDNNIEEFLTSIGLDIEGFKNDNTEDIEDIYQILSSVEQRVIEENYEILRSISLESEVYKMRKGHMYLADSDLNRKLTLLRAKGISEAKIQELIKYTNSGLREDFATVEARVIAIENLHQKLDEENINLLQVDVAQYEKNLETLASNGYELDEKEIRNHNLLLFESLNIPSNVEVLKEYLISIVRNNGKYALSVFWKNPIELLIDIDNLIEADLENIIATNPETLEVSATEVIKRVKYCEEKGEPIYEGNGRTEFCKHISSYSDFYKKYGPSKNFPSIISMNEVNDMLPRLIGNEDYTEIIINTLESEYSNIKSLVGIEIVPEMKEEYDRLRYIMENQYNATVAGKYTYHLGDICISKNKFERNLILVLNALAQSKQSSNGVEREIILASALFNLRQDEETLSKVVGSCLGFNEENTLGGMTL